MQMSEQQMREIEAIVLDVLKAANPTDLMALHFTFHDSDRKNAMGQIRQIVRDVIARRAGGEKQP